MENNQIDWLEEGEEGSDDFELRVGEFSSVFVIPSDWTIGTLYSLIGKQIDLDPNFQRRNVWSRDAKSRFIESLFLGVPIPQILLSARKNDKNSFLILDGKQRLIAIKEFLDGKYFDGRPFKLSGLRILGGELNGKTWQEICEDPAKKGQLLNETLRTVVMRGWEHEEVLYEIFYRLNSGSVKLSPMELRMSLHPGDFLKFIVKWSEQPSALHKLLRRASADPRMADTELAIRFLGFRLSRHVYRGNLKLFLDDTSKSLNKEFAGPDAKNEVVEALNDMCAAIELGLEVFGSNFCRKFSEGTYEKSFNRAVFDVLVGSLADHRVRQLVRANPEEFVGLFERTTSNGSFVKSVESTTKSIEATKFRFGVWYGAVSEWSGFTLTSPRIEFREV